MPSIKDVETFSEKLFSLADEPGVLAERGEEPARVELPRFEQVGFTSSAGETTRELEPQKASEYLEKFETAESSSPEPVESEQQEFGLGQSEIASLMEDLGENPQIEGGAESLENEEQGAAVVSEDTELQSLFESIEAPADELSATKESASLMQDINDSPESEDRYSQSDDLEALLSFEDEQPEGEQTAENLSSLIDDGEAESVISPGIAGGSDDDQEAIFGELLGEDSFAAEPADSGPGDTAPSVSVESASDAEKSDDDYDAAEDLFSSLFSEGETAEQRDTKPAGPAATELTGLSRDIDESDELEALMPLMEEQNLQEDDIHAANLSSRRIELAEKKSEIEATLLGEETESPDDAIDIPDALEESLIEAEIDESSADDDLVLVSKPKEPQSDKEEHSFSEEEYEAIFQNLRALPFDIRKECAVFIANPDSSQEEVFNVISLLQNDAAPNVIVRMLNRYTGNNFVLPYGYARGTASEYFEREKARKESPARKALQRIGVTTAGLIGLVLASLLFANFVYRPVLARSLYRQGYERLEEENYVESDILFEQAWDRWNNDSWALRYARAYTDRDEYTLASRKYDELVYGLDVDLRDFLIQKTREKTLLDQYAFGDRYERLIDLININKTGIYEHALLQSKKLRDFQRADELLSIVLTKEPYEEDALLHQGDNFIRWSDEDILQLDAARRTYAVIAREHGVSDELHNRFAWYFSKADRLKDLLEFMPDIATQAPSVETDVQIFSDIAEYLIHTNELFFVSGILQRLRTEHPYAPEGHYHSARYFRIINSSLEERVALDNTISTLSVLEPLRWTHLSMYVDTKTRIAENYYANDQLIDAERTYQEALERYVLGIETKTLDPDPRIARFYEKLGDIRYYHSKNFEEARRYYEQALMEGINSRELFYKTGHVVFRDQEYAIAAQHFLNAETHPPREAAGLLAMGSALYHLESYSTAESYFLQLVDLLEEKRSAIRLFLPFEDPEHEAIISYLIQAYNGLGASRYRLVERGQNNGQEAQAILALERAITLFENYNRSQDDLQRSLAKSLPYVNLREILYPQDSFDVEIYNVLPFDFDELSFEQLTAGSADS